MANDSLTRNLRDGQLVISDGHVTPKTLTLALDMGDLSWTRPVETIEIKDRGVLDHTRPGDQMSCEMSFSARWTQLIGYTVTTTNGHCLYEMLNNVESVYTSTSGAGQQHTLKYEFSVTAPGGTTANGEKITFAKVYATSINPSEGAESNMINFQGRDFETQPTIVRLS